VYRLNAEQYYKKHDAEVKADVDLEGLMPTHEELVDLSAVCR
jgi:hypothetical protein